MKYYIQKSIVKLLIWFITRLGYNVTVMKYPPYPECFYSSEFEKIDLTKDETTNIH